MAEYRDGPRAMFVEQLQNTAVPRPRSPSYATFSADYAEAMTNILAEAASNHSVDQAYIQSEFNRVSDSFTEDYTSYYAD